MYSKILKYAEKRWGKKTFEQLAGKLAEETGEVNGAAIKMGEGRMTEQDLQDEVGDVLFVCAQFAAKMDKTLDEILRERVDTRHPDLVYWRCAKCVGGHWEHHHRCQYHPDNQ